ncbi:sterol 3-beta-glucosyltransferase UGT80A2 [Silene latifolia]|uniref:sterol 3-beta-glucosyltransferase UGT80A2 n=1 Tax=Silene latifolia TaxID=37657 RepID=UPI003D7701CE
MAEDSHKEREISTSSSSDGHGKIAGATLTNNNGANSPVGISFSRVQTLPAEKRSFSNLEPELSQSKLERSKTESQRTSNILASEAAQIFDNKISVQQKLKLLNRIATVKDDGTVEFEVPGDIEPHTFGGVPANFCRESADEDSIDDTDLQYIPPLQIVMLIVGTRGDVQPFIAIGKKLQDYGHRVRLATHANFKDFVLTSGLEFFPLGGDPKILAEYMVKNKGFLPSGPSEIPTQRVQMKEIIYSLPSACRDPDVDSGVPFKADAIIANPPAYGHTHVAEALKIPLHIFFTMPWTPTSEFPHPLSRVKQPAGYRLSYQIVDSLIWLGIRDMINDVRKKKLKLRPVTYLSGSQGSENDVPHGYIWSPHLVPKPKDWGPKVDVVGFCFLDLASNYEPPQELVAWLNAGPKPVYVGFGSLPVQEPEKMTQIIVEALEKTGQRGIINKGWGGLGDLAEPKESIYLLDNCPHDWLFPRCASVVHHGGAGTTAAGLKAACPTAIVPFFGDQPFWGERVHARGVGPPPIPIDEFSLNKLVDAIKFMLDPQVKERALELSKAMENEDGVTGAVKAFFKQLPRKKADHDSTPEPSGFLSITRCFGCA